jgi:RNA polymerase sigma factor (sigma-70 family)
MRNAVDEAAEEKGTDADLVERARAGHPASYETLYRRHRDRVARTAYLLIRDPTLAQDLAQEAFLIGWRDLRRLRDQSLFRAWVTGIAVNLSRRAARGSAREAPRSPPEPPADPDRDLAVRAAVETLPRRLREAIVLRFYGGFTEAEMAAALRVPTGTVKSRLSRARSRLAEALSDVMEER